MCARRKTGYKAIVMGVSTGGVAALKRILGGVTVDFPIPIIIATHITPDSGDALAVLLDSLCAIRVKEADDGEQVIPGTVYMAPANYHLLVERGGCLALSVDPPINYARPSVDALFESAAVAYGPGLIGVILTGAGFDGAKGLLKIKNNGGVTIVQEPADAEMESMPVSALQLLQADHIVPLQEIPDLLTRLAARKT
jgi:two-component system chemotaxis response regulator CheB